MSLTPDKKRNIYLIGMPGSGKSTIGRALAKCLGLKFIDADHALIERTGVAIATIFELEGEAGFRTRESTLISELCAQTEILVATGGGSVLSAENRQQLHATGVVVYLHARLDDIWIRTRHDNKRPLLRSENPRAILAALLEIREPLYAEIADLVVETVGYPKVAKLAQEIADRLVQNQLWDPPPPQDKRRMTNDTPLHCTNLQVSLGERSYPILIGPALLTDATNIVPFLPAPRVVLVTNDTIYPLYGQALTDGLRRAGIHVVEICLPDGEKFKDWPALNQIFDALMESACDRKTTIIALGGGVIGDIAGFAAATYQRGIPYIQIPTTLLAQVDSSVGGKTAINHPRGKNMIGAFYQPQLVLADTDTLKTLPDREYRAGLSEVIKYGIGLDATFFDWLEANINALNNGEATVLAYAIKRSCEIKARIVAADERETTKDGGRALLNLGHTFGHAIETALGYGVWLHGEAVACGMLLAARLSHQLGAIDMRSLDRITALLNAAGLPQEIPNIATNLMLEHMGRDKKNEGGNIRLILLTNIGASVVDATVTASRIGAFLDSQNTKKQAPRGV